MLKTYDVFEHPPCGSNHLTVVDDCFVVNGHWSYYRRDGDLAYITEKGKPDVKIGEVMVESTNDYHSLLAHFQRSVIHPTRILIRELHDLLNGVETRLDPPTQGGFWFLDLTYKGQGAVVEFHDGKSANSDVSKLFFGVSKLPADGIGCGPDKAFFFESEVDYAAVCAEIVRVLKG